MKRESIVAKLLEEILPLGILKSVTRMGKGSKSLNRIYTSPKFLRRSSADIVPVTCLNNAATSCKCGVKSDKKVKKNSKACVSGVEAGTTEDKYVMELMFFAIQYRNSELLNEVITRSKIDTNLLNEDGISASHFSAIVGSSDCITVLNKHGACVNLYDIRGQTPLYYAHMMENQDVYKCLQEMGGR